MRGRRQKPQVRSWCALVLCGASLACSFEDGRARPDPPERPIRELPAVIRAGMRPMMRRHAESASMLTRAIALNDHDEIVALAQNLLDEPKPATPEHAPKEALNKDLPDALFALDVKLREELTGLRDAARDDDDDAILRRFAGVIGACRACHGTFRPPSESAAPHAPEAPPP